jgi:hypothetical protein
VSGVCAAESARVADPAHVTIDQMLDETNLTRVALSAACDDSSCVRRSKFLLPIR